MNEEEEIEETLEPQPQGGALTRKKKKVDAVGLSYFGETFDGYMRVGEVSAFLPAFKEMWYQMKVKDHGVGLVEIIRAFNASIAPEKFHPYPSQIRLWVTKWKRDLMQQMHYKEETSIIPTKDVKQVIKTRSGNSLEYHIPEDAALEMGVRTLGGELLNDALQMMRDDQELEELIDGEELIKRKNYIVNVFSQVTKMTQGKAALMLKASQEKRENASFLMDLLRKAAAGEMTEADLALLKQSNIPTPVESEAIPA